MSVPSLLVQPTPQAQVPQPPAAALAQVHASLEALSAKLGQVLDATVLATAASGLTQIRLGAETLTLQLSQPLPPGTPVQLSVQPAASGAVQVTVQPLPAAAVMPAPVAPHIAIPAVLPLATQMSPAAAPQTPVLQVAAGAPVPSVPAPQPMASQPPIAAPPATPAPLPPPGAVHSNAMQAAPPQAAPPSPGGTAPAPVVAQPVAAGPTTTVATAPSPVQVPPAVPNAATPAPATVASAPAQLMPPPPAAQQMAQPAQPAITAPAPQVTATPAVVTAAPTPSPAMAGLVPMAGPAAALPLPESSAGSPARSVPTAPATPNAPQAANRPAPQATPIATAVSRAAPPLATILAQPAQAAAQQDSIAPLLQNLSAMQTRMAGLPLTIADAATRLLATRLPLDRGPPSAAAIKSAIQRSGVFLDPPGKASSQPTDVKTALLQLRAGLMSLLGNGEISAVAPVSRRPPPPLRDAQPRGVRPDAPSISDSSTPRESARTLLHQTDAALSRLKLTQLAAQPGGAEATRAAAAAPDFMVELPMTLGAELAMAQLQVQCDGKGKGKASERGWRMRFAVSLSAIGEVGAQVSLHGKTTNVMIWAGEVATAEALGEMLPELSTALAARGLTVGSVRLRHGVPKDDAPAAAGRLMDDFR